MSKQIEKAFSELVELRFQLYEGLFLNLPLNAVKKTGVWLPLLNDTCLQGYDDRKSPETIINEFFDERNQESTENEKIDFLFEVIQYVERQVVLVDALEDAAYEQIHRIDGSGSWHFMSGKLKGFKTSQEISEILGNIGVRVVLTAHPTQFYPKTVLAIISDLTDAIKGNQTSEIRNLLEQLGRTPFFRKSKPSPYDEASLLITHLKQVFYPAIGKLLDDISKICLDQFIRNDELIRLGFWPGGDRDGNPNVTVNVTRQVAAELKQTIISCYYKDITELTRRLSFPGIHERLSLLLKQLHQELRKTPSREILELEKFKQELEDIENCLIKDHSGLFLDKMQAFRRKVQSFGFHFASLDIRQDSRIIHSTLTTILGTHDGLVPNDFDECTEGEQIEILLGLEGRVDISKIENDLLKDTAKSFGTIRDIQADNGISGAHRYIISNCRSALDIARVFALFRLCGWQDTDLTVDIVPLFETVDDLKNAAKTMRYIYQAAIYRDHLKLRGNRQTVMLGFSDGTKDGGYLMANWAIYSAKEGITTVSRYEDLVVYFFDGRGGPPARGGGSTHLFYTAMGHSIENRQVQTTLQGQTITTLYGIKEAAVHNLELLLTAGLKSQLFATENNEINEAQKALLDDMAVVSYQAYQGFKEHPLFIPYLLERSPLKYYGETNISSRPTERKQGSKFSFDDLRAIPFVGAWSQLKQNVPGFFGLGTALKTMEDQGRLDEVMQLFQEVDIFKAIITNSMQSMSKSNFDITRYMQDDEKFGVFWNLIYKEFELTREMVLKISGQMELLGDSPRSRQSIRLREKVVLPLLTIQQFALMRIQKLSQSEDQNSELISLYDKMVIRSLFGNINATRNSV